MKVSIFFLEEYYITCTVLVGYLRKFWRDITWIIFWRDFKNSFGGISNHINNELCTYHNLEVQTKLLGKKPQICNVMNMIK